MAFSTKELVRRLRRLSRLEPTAYRVSRAQRRNKKLAASLATKPKVIVAFQIVHASIWKMDSLYWMFERSEHFEPIVVICPAFPASGTQRDKEYRLSKNLCEKNGYRFFETLRGKKQVRLSKIGIPSVDVVFIQNAWELTRRRYRAASWKKSLVCYVPYFFTLNTLSEANYGKLFHKTLYRYFLESRKHLGLALKHRRNFDQDNLVVSGYPGLDSFLFFPEKPDPWQDLRVSGFRKVRVIYAPHHTVSGADSGLSYSTFERFAEHILSFAARNQDSFHFAFKPHPLLFDKLVDHPDWGPSRTRLFWADWAALTNAQVEEAEYDGLFIHSDALLHDSNSFLAEYLATGKPALFLRRSKDTPINVNEVGKRLLAAHHHAQSAEDIDKFLELLRDDPGSLSNDRRHKRMNFFDQIFLNDRKIPASQAIFEHLEYSLTHEHYLRDR
jgi:hypothetical protein